jgi:hypothetical protein
MASAYIVMEKEDDPRARGTLNVSIEQLKKITIEIEYKVKQLTRSSFSFTIAAFIFARGGLSSYQARDGEAMETNAFFYPPPSFDLALPFFALLSAS